MRCSLHSGQACKIDILELFEGISFRLFCDTFELQGLLSRPCDDEGTCWPLNEIWILARALYSVEDDLYIASTQNIIQTKCTMQVVYSTSAQNGEKALTLKVI